MKNNKKERENTELMMIWRFLAFFFVEKLKTKKKVLNIEQLIKMTKWGAASCAKIHKIWDGDH